MSSGCQAWAIIFQAIAALIWVATAIFVIYFIRKSCAEPSPKSISFNCYQCFFSSVKYVFIFISLPIPFDDTINMYNECLSLYGEDSSSYGSSLFDALSSFLYILQFLIIPTLSFMKAHWAFKGTELALSNQYLTVIAFANILFWTLFFGIFVVTFMIQDLNVFISYSIYIFLVFMYIAMTIWAQLIFNNKLKQVTDTKGDKAMAHLITKHKLMIRVLLWCLFINMFIGAIYLMMDIKFFWFIWQISIYLDIMINLLCIMLTYRAVENVYDILYYSKLCNKRCKACCLCSCCCYADSEANEDLNNLELVVSSRTGSTTKSDGSAMTATIS